MNTVFLLEHLHVLPDGEDSVKTIGVYRSRDAAVAAVMRVRSQVGFADWPDIIEADVNRESPAGFYIDEYELDMDHWTEGYITQ